VLQIAITTDSPTSVLRRNPNNTDEAMQEVHNNTQIPRLFFELFRLSAALLDL